VLSEKAREDLLEWLLEAQYREIHPYTMAPPGGWAWTDLPGGVPDADDTAGALIALHHLGADRPPVLAAAASGLRWLARLQNRDGGIPTFCRGWGKLPFDRSSADLTAHALRAFRLWAERWPRRHPHIPRSRLQRVASKGAGFLRRAQHASGYWTPLWFGNEDAPDLENRTYGTARVLLALSELQTEQAPIAPHLVRRGVDWLLRAQNEDGGWGGAGGVESSLEETALALEALAACGRDLDSEQTSLAAGLRRGVHRLLEKIESHEFERATPIGFYFANLWYHEKLYPLIFALAALGRLRRRPVS
jgi:squalene-hopene/tetraprenyl-beta-curcumene cyclase